MKTKLLTGLLLVVCIGSTSCNRTVSENSDNINDSTKIKKMKEKSSIVIDRDSVLKIAEKNAKTVYNDLSIYDVNAEMKEGKWYVDYVLSDPGMNGGGPHYVISSETGEILSYRYEQ